MKKIISTLLALATLISIITVSALPAAAASYSTNYTAYTTPSNSDSARWNGSRMVKSSKTTTSEVKWMQAAINYCIANEGLNTSYIEVDGKFGPATKAATLAFQSKAGIATGAHLHFGVMVGKATAVNHDQPRYDMAIDPKGTNISYRNYK